MVNGLWFIVGWANERADGELHHRDTESTEDAQRWLIVDGLSWVGRMSELADICTTEMS